MGSFGDRLNENMRLMSEQTPAQLAFNLLIIVVILGGMAALRLVPIGAVIGGVLGYVAIQAIARLRNR